MDPRNRTYQLLEQRSGNRAGTLQAQFPSREKAEQELARQANEVIDNIISDIENEHFVNGNNTAVEDLEFEVDGEFLSVADTRKALENGVEGITIEHGYYEFEGCISD